MVDLVRISMASLALSMPLISGAEAGSGTQQGWIGKTIAQQRAAENPKASQNTTKGSGQSSGSPGAPEEKAEATGGGGFQVSSSTGGGGLDYRMPKRADAATPVPAAR